jgi:hypothetical protein
MLEDIEVAGAGELTAEQLLLVEKLGSQNWSVAQLHPQNRRVWLEAQHIPPQSAGATTTGGERVEGGGSGEGFTGAQLLLVEKKGSQRRSVSQSHPQNRNVALEKQQTPPQSAGPMNISGDI